MKVPFAFLKGTFFSVLSTGETTKPEIYFNNCSIRY